MGLLETLNNDIKKILNGLGYDDNIEVTVSNRKDLGDYQYNGIMKIAGQNKVNPRELAEKVCNLLKENKTYKDVNIAGPGFINVSFSDEALIEFLNDTFINFDNIKYKAPKKTIFMDYGGANIAKELHVGHMRSANIGEALKRLFNVCNIDTISDAHLGDWGKPMGLVMQEIKTRMPDLPYFDENFEGEYPKESPVTAEDLASIYPIASKKSKEDENYLNSAKELTVKLQQKDKGTYTLWQHIRNTSLEDIKKTYKLLNTSFDLYYGESDSDKYVPEMIDYLNKNDYLEKSEGAEVIFVNKEDDNKTYPPLMVKMSNGGIGYDTTELATIYQRKKEYKFDELLYLTDNRQDLHFEITFRAAKKCKIADEKMTHISFGNICGNDGKPFKTRDGGVMSLNNLYSLVYDECYKKLSDNVKEEDKEDTARIISVAAIKYADLLPNRTSDYVFDPVRFSDLNGKTGPYLLYNTVRINSIFSKMESFEYKKYNNINTSVEREIILHLLELPNVLKREVEDNLLNELCEYIFKLTNLYNSFYSDNYIISEEDTSKKESWLVMSDVVLNTNKFILDILGMEVPKSM